VLRPGGRRAEEPPACAVERTGRMLLRHAHARRLCDGAWSHLAQVGPQRDVRDWMVPHAPAGSPWIGRGDDRLQLLLDGTVFVARNVESLRIFAPHGRLLWRSLATDGDMRWCDLEEARRPKRTAESGDVSIRVLEDVEIPVPAEVASRRFRQTDGRIPGCRPLGATAAA
jgi:hypothetical protein